VVQRDVTIHTLTHGKNILTLLTLSRCCQSACRWFELSLDVLRNRLRTSPGRTFRWVAVLAWGDFSAFSTRCHWFAASQERSSLSQDVVFFIIIFIFLLDYFWPLRNIRTPKLGSQAFYTRPSSCGRSTLGSRESKCFLRGPETFRGMM
jgi:hypothetical protein